LSLKAPFWWPGDTAPEPVVGKQYEPQIARGGGMPPAVWTGNRTALRDVWRNYTRFTDKLGSTHGCPDVRRT
jgi:hypothetical protein